MSKTQTTKKQKEFSAAKFIRDHKVDVKTISAADAKALLDAELAAGVLRVDDYFKVAQCISEANPAQKYDLLSKMRCKLDELGFPNEAELRREFNSLQLCAPFLFYRDVLGFVRKAYMGGK